MKSFSLDSEDELRKIMEETSGPNGIARDLVLFVRVAVPAINSRIPLERKFGVAGEKAQSCWSKCGRLPANSASRSTSARKR